MKDNPVNFCQAMQDPNSKRWIETTNKEYNFIQNSKKSKSYQVFMIYVYYFEIQIRLL